MNNKSLELVKAEEGYKQFPYTCSAGKLTIGYGFNLEDVGLSEGEAEVLLEYRLQKIEEKMFHHHYWYRYLNEDRRAVIDSMVYQLGYEGFTKFKKLINALEDEDYAEAAIQMLDSLWAKQTPERALRASEIMKQD